jgi:acyl-coenzyme A thioesterase 13
MTLHGGCAATLIDNLTNVVIIAASPPGVFSNSGISRNIRMTFLCPLPLGTEVRAVCKVVHRIGKRLVLVRAELYNVKTGELCVVGEHEKVNTDRSRVSKV